MYDLYVIYKNVIYSLLCLMSKQRVKKQKKAPRIIGADGVRLAKLGVRIKELRKKQGYTSALDFALDTELSFTQVARWETGKNMTFDSLCRIADALQVSLSELLKDI